MFVVAVVPRFVTFDLQDLFDVCFCRVGFGEVAQLLLPEYRSHCVSSIVYALHILYAMTCTAYQCWIYMDLFNSSYSVILLFEQSRVFFSALLSHCRIRGNT